MSITNARPHPLDLIFLWLGTSIWIGRFCNVPHDEGRCRALKMKESRMKIPRIHKRQNKVRDVGAGAFRSFNGNTLRAAKEFHEQPALPKLSHWLGTNQDRTEGEPRLNPNSWSALGTIQEDSKVFSCQDLFPQWVRNFGLDAYRLVMAYESDEGLRPSFLSIKAKTIKNLLRFEAVARPARQDRQTLTSWPYVYQRGKRSLGLYLYLWRGFMQRQQRKLPKICEPWKDKVTETQAVALVYDIIMKDQVNQVYTFPLSLAHESWHNWANYLVQLTMLYAFDVIKNDDQSFPHQFLGYWPQIVFARGLLARALELLNQENA